MTLKNAIWKRQYAINPEETVEAGIQRIASAIASVDENPEQSTKEFADLLLKNHFWPGGRILSGAATEHGNLLNCFVTDGAPYEKGTNEWVLETARKLALITKVGGGNGVNLDPIAPKSPNPNPTGQLFITIRSDHPDHDNVQTGTFRNDVTGEVEANTYRHATITNGEPGTPTETILVPDSIEGIWTSAAKMVQLLLNGEDVTLDLSELRPAGSFVRGSGGNSSGPASFAFEIFDHFAHWAHLGGAKHAGPVATLRYVFAPTLRSIKQGGVRRGAGMATLAATHQDVLDFVTSKDLEREETEGSIGTFNISVLAHNNFMKNAFDVRNPAGRPAAELLGTIANHAWQTGEPGMLYVDTINEHNPLLETDGPIVSTNPCGEIVLYAGEPCDLGALNLATHFTPDGTFNYDLLEQNTRTAVRFLDNVLTAEKAPIQDIADAIIDKRRIGLGFMGLADTLIKLGVPYNSEEGRSTVRKIISLIRTTALKESERLGELRGIPAACQRAGVNRRNIAVLTVAPTGTTSMLAEASSGIEPVFAASYTRRIGTEYRDIIHPLLHELISNALDHRYVTDLIRLDDNENHVVDEERMTKLISENNGSIQPLIDDGLLPDTPSFRAFVVAHDIAAPEHVRMQATVQNVFDYADDGSKTMAGNSISKTINMPNEANLADVLYSYKLGWEEGLKGITVYRDGSRNFQVLTTGQESSNKKNDAAEDSREAVVAHLEKQLEEAREKPSSPPSVPQEPNGIIDRPQAVQGTSFKHELAGTKVYVQVFKNQHEQVCEIWTPASKGATPAESTTHEIIGRLASLALKYGAPAASVAQSFEGHMDPTGGMTQGVGYVGSKWDLVANAIHALNNSKSRAQVEAETHPDQCECGSIMTRIEGCLTCMTCGYSQC